MPCVFFPLYCPSGSIPHLPLTLLGATLLAFSVSGAFAQAQSKPGGAKPAAKAVTKSKSGQRLAPAKTAAPAEQQLHGFGYRLFRKNTAGKYQPRPLHPAGDLPYASRSGQFLTMFLEYRTGKDSLLMATRKLAPLPQPLPLPAQPLPGSLEEAVSLLLPGDSAVFRFNADSVFAKTFHQAVPPFVKRGGNAMRVYARAFEILTPDQMQARQQQMQAEAQAKAQVQSAKQLALEDGAIQDYLKKNNLTAQKTSGGTYYVITQPGTGATAQKGQTVSVLYKGSIMATGAVFDASERHGNTPFDFPLGAGQVIQGWDQGIAMLNKGSKAILLIPSPLGYGTHGAGADIPANSILRFDVELVNIK